MEEGTTGNLSVLLEVSCWIRKKGGANSIPRTECSKRLDWRFQTTGCGRMVRINRLIYEGGEARYGNTSFDVSQRRRLTRKEIGSGVCPSLKGGEQSLEKNAIRLHRQYCFWLAPWVRSGSWDKPET